ncbi:hypothetical protein CQU01_16160 [Cerasibacillus quisquiliarum]|uniref:Uncharacterized protein n=1 Tax=Cerasibacillus quisquiliarum TaxID=227865 RepID=A0A511V0A8_9BACI|nr:hypothetical protein CQU01_16160 [Cerasibacillus quisquiliarum]
MLLVANLSLVCIEWWLALTRCLFLFFNVVASGKCANLLIVYKTIMRCSNYRIVLKYPVKSIIETKRD